MVAVVVVSVGLAGIAQLLVTGTALTTGAQERTLAALHATSFTEWLALAEAPAAWLAAPPAPPSNCDASSSCTAVEFAASGHAEWRSLAQADLPGAAATVCRDTTPDDGSRPQPDCDGGPPLAVKLMWTPAADQPARVALPAGP